MAHSKSKPTNGAVGLAGQFLAVEADLNGILLEREDVIRGITLGILSRQHTYLLGPPGTAKSLLVTETVRRMTGFQSFIQLMTRFTEPGELFGPVSIPALQKGRYERVTTGMLPESHIVFLDEIFKANSAILNALLTILNERRYRNGTQMKQAALESCIGASNELPQGEDLGALYDRFIQRFFVPAIQEDQNFIQLLSLGSILVPTVTVSASDVAKAQANVEGVTISQDVLQAILKIRTATRQAGIFASDRRYRQALGIIKAQAWLSGRDHAVLEDLLVFRNILWSDPDSRTKVAGLVLPIAAPHLQEIQGILDKLPGLMNIIVDGDSDLDAKKKAMQRMKVEEKLAKKAASDAGKGTEAERIFTKVTATLRRARVVYGAAVGLGEE